MKSKLIKSALYFFKRTLIEFNIVPASIYLNGKAIFIQVTNLGFIYQFDQ